ncbi:MAG: nucleotidyltransferase domain-containing protein [Armatimonadetes bacterium]|nr:nucleotidyltransferase domain-containing protein [Armatimonadota bacterium]
MHEPPILPRGTQVVTKADVTAGEGRALYPRGSMGVIAHAPTEPNRSYRVRFPDGVEVSLMRKDLAIRKHVQREGLEPGDADPDTLNRLYDSVIYRCVVGSRAYGLEEEGSDTDRRGIYLPPADLEWSLFGVPGQLEREETQEVYWEMQKFLTLALKANPTVLECLNSPLVEHADPLAEELLSLRSIFLSQLIYSTYNGYIMSQFKKLEGDLRNRGEIRWKHAMHLIRLLLTGITAMREAYVPVRVEDPYRERLRAIRRGETPWEEVNAWRLELHRAFDRALEDSPLPERPDYGAANDFLIRARRSRALECEGQ